MNIADQLIEKVLNDQVDNNLRYSIADLILGKLEELNEAVSNWEIYHFAEAISSLVTNINTQEASSGIWLRRSLMNYKYAILPVAERSETATDKEIYDLDIETLIKTVKQIKTGLT